MFPGLLFDALPWWLAAPLFQLGVLVVGMALDETYVNRATILAGAIAVYAHVLVAGEAGLLVGLYLDGALVVGAYGLYAYVVDAYVANWFRVLAYFVYSPLSVFLVILTAGVPFTLPIALVVAGYANLQLMDYLHPTEPYYFGPEDPEAFAEAIAEADAESTGGAEASEAARTDGTPTDEAAEFEVPDGADVDGSNGGDRPGAEPTPAGGDPTERGILPEFMRRL